jgi:putative transposase
MPWEVSDVVKQRARFVQEWESEDWSLAELCREYGISRRTGYKWINRYEGSGMEGLQDASRAARGHPNQTSQRMVDRILEVRGKHAWWGARKIRAVLARELGAAGAERVPATSTIGVILRQYGLTASRKKRMRAEGSRQPLVGAAQANELWCIDYKGWFRTGDGQRCDPLTVTDRYSRYLLRCQAVEAADGRHTRAVMEGAFQEYGMPRRMRSDNGAPFASTGLGGLTRLAVWWLRLGIQLERITPGQPQQNGSHERMHLTLGQETASPPARSRRQQQERFDAFREEYNQQRPHEGLQMETPAAHYAPSPRPYPRRLPEPDYGGSEVRVVDESGKFRFWSRSIFVSHALAGESIGLQMMKPEEERYWKVCFMQYDLGILDQAEGKIWTPGQWEKHAEGLPNNGGKA